ncbi:MAG: DMT family transporter [Anaerovoracaceae bacterium]|jgi:DME family drug/metabolite transporter
MKKNETKGMGYLLTAGMLWGLAGIFVNQLTALGAGSDFISFCRVAPAFLILLVVASCKYGRKLFQVSARTLVFCALTGIFCQAVYNMCYTRAIELVGMSTGAILLYLAPVMTALTSAVIFQEKLTRWKALALLINIAGCVLTVTGGGFSGSGNLPVLGILFGVGAAAAYSLAPIFGRFAVSDTEPLISTTWTFCFATVFLMVVTRPVNDVASVSGIYFLTILGYAFVPTSLAYLIYYFGLSRITESSRVPVLTSTEPVVATLIGVLVYHDSFGVMNLIGMLLVLSSILLMNPEAFSSFLNRRTAELTEQAKKKAEPVVVRTIRE